jgi:hypothetical protein
VGKWAFENVFSGFTCCAGLEWCGYLRFSHIQNKIQKVFLDFFSGKIDKEQIDSEISTPLLGKGIPVILGILSTTFFVSGLIWGISSFKF